MTLWAWLRTGLWASLAIAFVFTLTIITKRPSHDRDWQPHLAITPSASKAGSVWTIAPVRDWTYDNTAPSARDWRTSATLDVDGVSTVWLVLEPHPGLPVMAHTLVLFGFDDGQLIGLTIEARKETHEKFAPLRGAMNRFELIYVWAEPRDLLARRAVMLGHEIEIYPLELSREQARAFLTSVLERTAAIHASPRFYNTAVSNCTNELAKAAGLPWDQAFIFTGGAARALHRRGTIAGGDFESVRQRANATGWIKAHGSLPNAAFNAGLLDQITTNTVAPFTKPDDSL